jgi:predicted O-methyltransferase YrrM
VVEIGSDAGGMLWAFREAGAGRVIGVDLPNGRYGSGRALQSHGADVVLGDSHRQVTKDELVALLDGRPIDLLFIDGDHTYDGVRADWRMYGPLVRFGGLVAFHDICHHALFPDVRVDRLWWELKARHPVDTSEIVYYSRPWGSGMGIGLITR